MFDGKYPGGGNVTSVVFHSGRDAFVFDSLLYPEDTRALLQRLKEQGLTVRGLVNTHWHIDHTAGNQLFLEANRIISHSLCGGLMRTEGKDDPEWANKKLQLEEVDRIRPAYPNEDIPDGSVLSVGSSEMKIVHTPGHTPDSIIGWHEGEEVLVAGDTVMEIPFAGYGDSRVLARSLNEIGSMVKRGGKIIQGHGGICGSERLADDVRYIEDLRKRAAEYLDSGKTAEEASAGIKLEECFSKERAKVLTEGFGSLLWCHPANVERVYSELKLERA